MSNRAVIMAGLAGFVLLAGAATWLMLAPGGGTASIAQAMSGTNPALEVRYHYNPDQFKPAPFVPSAEFPLRLDSGNWSFYGKRLQGPGKMLSKETPAAAYGFIAEVFSGEYTEFYKLQASSVGYDEVRLSGQPVMRQQMVLQPVSGSRGWPSYFPRSVTGDRIFSLTQENEQASALFRDMDLRVPEGQAPAGQTGSQVAYLYAWAMFHGDDLYFFQAIAPQELTGAELGQAEKLIEQLEFDAVGVTSGGSVPE